MLTDDTASHYRGLTIALSENLSVACAPRRFEATGGGGSAHAGSYASWDRSNASWARPHPAWAKFHATQTGT